MNLVKKYLPQTLLVIASAFWGASFIFTKELFLTEAAITPYIIITGRMLLATVVTIPFLLITHRLEPIKKGHLKFFLLLALAEPFLYSICETNGVQRVSGSLASIVVATIPLFVPFAMAAVYKEKLRFNAVAGVVLSLAGIALMSMGDTSGAGSDGQSRTAGLLFLSGAVIIAVFYTITLVKILPHYRPFTITAYQNLIALIYFIPLTLLLDAPKLPLLSYSPHMFFLLAFLGVFCSTVAYAFFNYGMRSLGATAGSVYNNIIPIFSLLLALAIGQEHLSALKVIGMVVVLAGLTLAQHKKKALS